MAILHQRREINEFYCSVVKGKTQNVIPYILSIRYAKNKVIVHII
jgi:hypothetical protein